MTPSAYGTYAADYLKKAAVCGDCNIIGIMFFFVMMGGRENVKIGAENQVHSIVFSKHFEWALVFILNFRQFLEPFHAFHQDFA